MSELSLAEELSQQLDQAVATEQPEKVETPAAEAAPEESTDTRARDEQGRFAKADKPVEQQTETPAAPEAQAPEQPAVESEQQAKPLSPPATWSAAAKTEYAKLPEVVRREIVKREQDFAKGIQQHAEKAKMADRYAQEFQPYEHIFRSLGATHEQFLRDSLATEYKLRTASPQEKTQLFLQYAHRYGADLSILPQMLGQGQQEEGQPDLQRIVQQYVGPLAQEVQSLRQQSLRASHEEQQQLEHHLMGQIEAFRNATDEQGNPKHMFFENVRGAMSALMGSGQANNLAEAYDMACYANPEVRAALIAQEQSKAEAKRLEEAKRKADESKRASFDVRGQGGIGIADTSKLSLRDELSSMLEGNNRL